MTSILNFPNGSLNASSPLNASTPLSSNIKYPTTFIIQPPSSHAADKNTLLNKRCKPVDLGELLLKKIKTQNSENSSDQSSPTLKENSDAYENSMIEDIDSPSIKSEDYQPGRRNINILSQNSFLAQLISLSTFSKTDPENNQRQLKSALEVLQKKMFIDYHASSLKDALIKAKLAQEPLMIPPLVPSSKSFPEVPLSRNTLKFGDDDLEVMYGDVEYPFLSMTVPSLNPNKNNSFAKGHNSSSRRQDNIISGDSSPSHESNKQNDCCFLDIRESLTATRAGTQKSESEMDAVFRETNEGFLKNTEKKRRAKKGEAAEKGKRTQKKGKEQAKPKVKEQKKNLMSAPSSLAKKRVAGGKNNTYN